jgi:hypothetical protein
MCRRIMAYTAYREGGGTGRGGDWQTDPVTPNSSGSREAP